ncbi:type III secretion system cytoplasmic ring protein SctQ [Sodalis sp. RH21]|uniref:type III secretion system cytoplasmic ring protein SctQ n=1 Tax=unclassified Sodalis (in: enterobacteria) TaxID=2636512 RepID=UPI0039B54749
MSHLQLRALSRADIAWRQALATWRAHGIAVGLDAPAGGQGQMAISADNGAWRAIIHARTWLAYHAPELAAMAGHACDDGKIMALFNAVAQPLTFEHYALPYRSLRAEAMVAAPSGPASPLPRLSARECPLWVTALDDCGVPPPALAPLRLGHIPLAVKWVIGTSRLPAGLAARLAVGDVMLITRADRQVICQGKIIGQFFQNEEMIMMDEHYEEYDLPEEDEPGNPGPAGMSDALSPVPLKLEFILQRRYLAIGEIQQLFAGKVLEMDPASEKKIEIRANGALLARGELVQLEDRLGVEVMELYQDMPDDQ